MIFDFILAVFFGFVTQSFFVSLVLIVLAAPSFRPGRPLSSGLLMALGVSALFSLFGGDCDCDL